jgi:hypothetical protein
MFEESIEGVIKFALENSKYEGTIPPKVLSIGTGAFGIQEYDGFSSYFGGEPVEYVMIERYEAVLQQTIGYTEERSMEIINIE